MKRTTVVDGMRPRSVCGAVLPVEAFTAHPTYCPPCRAAYSRRYYAEHAGKWRVYHGKGEKPERKREPEPLAVAVAVERTAAAQPIEVVGTKKAGPKKTVAKKAAQGQPARLAGHGVARTDVERLDAVERRPGRVPKLFGERQGGVHMCYVSDGVEETGLFVWAWEAVGAWNEGEVAVISDQWSVVSAEAELLEMDRAHLEECARSGVLDSGDNCVARESITSVAGS